VTRTAVVGGGAAGLAAAIDLAVAGREVVLIERETAFGGKAGLFERGGYRFDTGPSVFTMPEVLRGLFRDAGRDLPLDIAPLELLCRYLYPSGRRWDVFRDVEATISGLSHDEAASYRALLDEARRLYEVSAPTFVFGDGPGVLDLLRYGLRHGLRAHPHRSLPKLLEAFGARGDLATFFLRFATYFGADPFRAPAVLHNIAWVELGLGVHNPAGGLRGVIGALVALARDLGVELRAGEGAVGLERSGRRVSAVATTAGRYPVDDVVSALDVVHTARLLGRRHGNERREPSLSGLVLLLGVEGETPELAEHSIAFPDDYRSEFEAIRGGRYPDDPTLYLHLSCRREPGDAPPGHENWFVMSNAPAVAGDAEAERRHAERMLGLLERRGLLDRGRVRMQHALGPRSLARFGHLGSLYGRAPHSLSATLRPGHRFAGLDNLALAGGTVHPGGGVPLALLSGRAAARLLLRRG
jgi:phytoene desaturase